MHVSQYVHSSSIGYNRSLSLLINKAWGKLEGYMNALKSIANLTFKTNDTFWRASNIVGQIVHPWLSIASRLTDLLLSLPITHATREGSCVVNVSKQLRKLPHPAFQPPTSRRVTWSSLMNHNLRTPTWYSESYLHAAPPHNSFKPILRSPLMNIYKTILNGRLDIEPLGPTPLKNQMFACQPLTAKISSTKFVRINISCIHHTQFGL
jgi:hypothetical protein